MTPEILLADIGNFGLVYCAAADTAAALSYAWRARGGHTRDGHERGAWWRSPTGWHLMCFMAAFATVLDLSAVYLITSGQVLAHTAVVQRPDWFAWLRVISFCSLIPAVLTWRLVLIWRPPRRPGDSGPRHGTEGEGS